MSAFTRVFPFCAFSLCLAFTLLTTPVWGQVYASGTLGFASFSSDSAYGNDDSGIVVAAEVGKEPGDSGFGYSVEYSRAPYGEENLSTISLGLKYEPGDGNLWIDAGLGRNSVEGVTTTGLTVGVFREFGNLLGGSDFVPYGGLGLLYAQEDHDDRTVMETIAPGQTVPVAVSCEGDSSIHPILEAGAKRKMSDTAEIKFALNYFTFGGDLECTNTVMTGPTTTNTTTSTIKADSTSLQALITYKRWF